MAGRQAASTHSCTRTADKSCLTHCNITVACRCILVYVEVANLTRHICICKLIQHMILILFSLCDDFSCPYINFVEMVKQTYQTFNSHGVLRTFLGAVLSVVPMRHSVYSKYESNAEIILNHPYTINKPTPSISHFEVIKSKVKVMYWERKCEIYKSFLYKSGSICFKSRLM